MILWIFIGPLALFALIRVFYLAKNYAKARSFGLPIIIIPISFEDIWWIPLRPFFSWVERLPFGLGYWYLYSEMGWPTVDGDKTVSRLGENFILCSPKDIQIVTAYKPTLEHVVKGHRNWHQPGAQSQLFAFYGENVASTNGAEWQRHRKITGTALNENCMQNVWAESIKRASELDFDREGERTLGRIRTTFDVLAMHVLAKIGFGDNTPLTSVPYGHRESLMECLGFILKNIMLVLALGKLKAPDAILPSILRRLKVSTAEFRLYMQELVLRHMHGSEKHSSRATSLLEAMVLANEAEKQQVQHPSAKPSYLSDSELFGNLFVFNVAGYETTAATMTFACGYLAAHPEIQDWLCQEIDAAFSSKTNRHEQYATIYPQLVRCLAFMHETLRLASPAPLLVRTPTIAEDIPVSTPKGPSTITVQPGILVGLHQYGAHLSSQWGPDADQFNPKRFVSNSEKGSELLEIPSGVAYLPWLFGPRVCPGKKFSQVEFVAIVAQVLSQYRVEAVQFSGKSEQNARERLLRTLDNKYFNISAHLRRGEDAGVRFVPRV